MHYLPRILVKFISAKIEILKPCGFSVINYSGHKLNKYSFKSAEIDNFSGHIFEENTLEIMHKNNVL